MPPTGVRTTQGLHNAASLLHQGIAQLAVGTGTTAPTEADAGLGAELLAKEDSPGESAIMGEAIHQIRVLASEGNGSNISEIGAKDAAGVLLARATFTPVAKTSGYEVVFRLKERVRNA